MDPKIIAALGLKADATLDDVLAAINALVNNTAATASQAKLLGTVALAAGLTPANDQVSEDQVTAICAKLKSPAAAGEMATMQATIDELQKQVATLSAKASGTEAEVSVGDAIKVGKITPAQKDWAISYCSRDPKGFADFVSKAPVILKDGRTMPEGVPEDALTENQVAMCAKLGIDQKDFKAELAARKENA